MARPGVRRQRRKKVLVVTEAQSGRFARTAHRHLDDHVAKIGQRRAVKSARHEARPFVAVTRYDQMLVLPEPVSALFHLPLILVAQYWRRFGSHRRSHSRLMAT